MALSIGNCLPSILQYDAPDAGYLALKPGQEVIIEYIGGSDEPDWLYGTSAGERGWFPKYCVLNAPRSPPPPLPPPPPPLTESAREQAAFALSQLEDDELEAVICEELLRRPELRAKMRHVPPSSPSKSIPWSAIASGEAKQVRPLRSTIGEAPHRSAQKNGSPTLPPAAESLQDGKETEAFRDSDSSSQKQEASEPLSASVKRTFCKFWQENKCTKGDSCTFAHGDHEIGQPIPEPGVSRNEVSMVSRKKVLCKFWQEGNCFKSPGCTFAHGEHELGQLIDNELARLFGSRKSDLGGPPPKSTVCKFWQEGKCTKGSACSFQHSEGDVKN